MALAVDSTGSNGGPATEVSSGSFSLTNTAGNVMIIAMSGFRNRTVSSLTYNGVAMTHIMTSTNSNSHKTFFYGLASPATGSNTLAWTLSGNEAPTFGWVTFTGGNTASPFGNNATSNDGGSAGTAISTSITTAHNNSYIFSAYYRNGGANIMTFDGSETEVWDIQDTAYGSEGSGGSYKSFPTAGATTMTCTLSSSRNWTGGAVEVREGAGASFTATPLMHMMQMTGGNM
ncbi:hypothetical protein KBA63_01480 [Candidatus Woesebacteria bacterium]|nr:hypothetical protein [Candidatus Woesebacteria bacterium]